MVDLAPNSTLTHGQRAITTPFHLLGTEEPDLTDSLGWVLHSCPTLTRTLLQKICGEIGDLSGLDIRLQASSDKGGYTDVELVLPGVLHLIIEAKKGWNLPTVEQLELYAARFSDPPDGNEARAVIALTDCLNSYSSSSLPKCVGKGVPVVCVSWTDVAGWMTSARHGASNHEKRWIDYFRDYMKEVVSMQDRESNLVYVVALSNNPPDGWSITMRDVPLLFGKYFHPVGGGYPKDPPNYVAFRYDGELQSIHHVDSYQVVTNMSTVFKEAVDEVWVPHYLYDLGPAIKPHKQVKAGKQYRARTLWCMLDTLLTCDTIADAVEETKQRQAGNGL